MILLLPQVAANSCLAAGSVAAWGEDSSLQCQVPLSASNVVAVAGGAAHSLALRSDGTVVGWGFNSAGQAQVPSNLTSVAAIAAGGVYSMALGRDGGVRVWGGLSSPPAGITNALAIAAGWSHALALRTGGTVSAWGSETNVPVEASNVVAIAAGSGYSAALRSDDTVVAWGDNAYGKATPPPWLTNVMAVAAGQDHCLALRRDGSVVAWGRSDHGQTNVPPNLTNAVAISAGALHSLALQADGTLVAWGDDTFSQTSTTPPGSGFIALSAGGYHSLAVRGDGAPFILSQPASQSVTVSKTAVFHVLATGALPLAYQWTHYGTNIPAATNSVLTLTNIQLMDGGPYAVVVGNVFSSTTSLPAMLTPIGTPPIVLIQPLDQTTICGDLSAFQVSVDGTTPFAYQWMFQGAPIADATRSTLTLTNVTPSEAGVYTVVITNDFGSTTTTGALQTVTVEPPTITSPLTASGIQGVPFTYNLTALHSPTSFGAQYLPQGLTIDPATGLVSGVPEEGGQFAVTVFAANACSFDSQLLVLTIAPSPPVITSPLTAFGSELAAFNYLITASGNPTWFGAVNLPIGLVVDANTGSISGSPTYSGEFDATIIASNVWGAATATLHFSIDRRTNDNLNIGNVTYKYSSPYLLDFQFSLYTLTDTNDPTTAEGLVIDPSLLSVTCLEDDVVNSPSETGAFVTPGSSKLIKVYLVLDFTESIASSLNGDTNGNGISDAVDFMVNGALDFVRQQAVDTQVGVYEFHRDDMAPSNVVALTSDKVRLSNAIGGIYTNYVRGFSSGSRCWDALSAAITGLGAANRDEQHFVVFVSDGRDESSTATLNGVINGATNAGVRIFSVGFGDELDPTTLQQITTVTKGGYYTAASPTDLAMRFAQVTKDTKAQYNLRWATLKRASKAFMPSFRISYAGLIATSPTNPFTIGETNIDTTTDPPTTNATPSVTNFIIGYYFPNSNAGPVTVGSLRVVPNAEVQPTGLDLRASYIPRFIRQMRIHYRPNYPCSASLQNTGPGQIFNGWSLSETNDSSGGKWMLLSSPSPTNLATSLPFASFGRMVTFAFQDMLNASNAFSVFEVDNTLYTNTGGQSFVFENTNAFLHLYPPLPYGTPIPWLMAYGFSGNFTNAETLDPDRDGMLTWQEYVANTNPTNAASVFLIRNVTRLSNGRFQVVFSTSTNRLYRVQASTDLTNWETLQENIPGVNQDISITDTRFMPNLTNIFYRAQVY